MQDNFNNIIFNCQLKLIKLLSYQKIRKIKIKLFFIINNNKLEPWKLNIKNYKINIKLYNRIFNSVIRLLIIFINLCTIILINYNYNTSSWNLSSTSNKLVINNYKQH